MWFGVWCLSFCDSNVVRYLMLVFGGVNVVWCLVLIFGDSNVARYLMLVFGGVNNVLVYKFKRIVGKSNFSDQFKNIVKGYIRVGYHATVCMPSFKPNHGL